MDDKGKVDKAKSRSILTDQFVYLVEDKNSKGLQVKCVNFEKIFKYHHSKPSLKYILMNKHAMSDASISSATSLSTSRQSTLDGHLVDGTVTQRKSLKLIQAILEWISKDFRPINIAGDKGLSKKSTGQLQLWCSL